MVTIRSGTVADAVKLAALAERTFLDTFTGDNSAADMAAHVARSYSPDQQRRELADSTITTLLSTDATDRLVGYAQLRTSTPPLCVDGPQPLEVWRFYVERSHHGRGVAQALMTAVLDRAAALGAGTVWLGVWEHNAREKAFYRKAGFADAGAHTFVLGSDLQTDRVMVRPLARKGAVP